MKYRLIIDKHAEEEIIAIVHHPSSLTEQIENLVYHYKGCDCIIGIFSHSYFYLYFYFSF